MVDIMFDLASLRLVDPRKTVEGLDPRTLIATTDPRVMIETGVMVIQRRDGHRRGPARGRFRQARRDDLTIPARLRGGA
jgi:hypothetical protein